MRSTTRRTLAAAVATSAAAMSLAACGSDSNDGGGDSGGSGGETVTLRWAHPLANEDPLAMAAVEAAEAAGKCSDGRIDIQIFPAGQLGGQAEITEAFLEGSVDMTLGSPPFAARPSLQIILAPFLFDDAEEMERSFRSDAGYELVWDPADEELGMKSLDFWFSGFNHFTSNKPFTGPDDMEGIKIRVPESEASIDLINDLGATATPIAFPELYTALQTGTVDAQYNPLSRIYATNFQEVQKYLIPAAISPNVNGVAITEQKWSALSGDDQQCLMDSIRDSGDAVLAKNVENDKQLLEDAAADFEILEPDRDAMVKVVEETWLPKYESILGEGVYEALQKAGKE
jgi:tripartite ATP-independent transporter DctP family solute receptor